MTRKIKNFGVGLLTVSLAVQLAGCDAAGGVKPSQVTCNQFLTQMQAHKYTTAYSLLSAKNKSLVTVAQLQNYWKSVEKSRGKVQNWTGQAINLNSGTGGGSSVRLEYALQCTNGTLAANFVCMPENGKWLIQSADFAG